MGQSNQKRQRLALLADLVAGPGPFPEPDQALLLLARTDASSRAQLASALLDLTRRSSLLVLLDELSPSAIENVAWVVITLMPDDGPVNFKLVRHGDDGLELVLNVFGESFAARNIRWSTLVFGEPADISHVRAQLFRFGEDLPKIGAKPNAPTVSIIDPHGNRRLVLEIPQDEIERMDLEPTLRTLDMFALNVPTLERLEACFTISVSGYDEDPRFLSEIPGVAAYLRQVLMFAPWAPLVAHPSQYLIWLPLLCEHATIETDAQGKTKVSAPAAETSRVRQDLTFRMAQFVSDHLTAREIPSVLEQALHDWAAFIAGTQKLPDAQQASDEQKASFGEAAMNSPEESAARDWLTTSTLPGWALPQGVYPEEDEARPIAADVYVYLVNTKSGAVFAGGFKEEQAELLLRANEGAPCREDIPSLAIQAVLDVEVGRADEGQQVKLAVVAAWSALGLTRLLSTIQQQEGSIRGHYLYLVCSLKDGHALARPGFADWEEPGVIPLPQVLGLAAKILSEDLSKANSISAAIKKGGGLDSCPELEALLTPKP